MGNTRGLEPTTLTPVRPQGCTQPSPTWVPHRGPCTPPLETPPVCHPLTALHTGSSLFTPPSRGLRGAALSRQNYGKCVCVCKDKCECKEWLCVIDCRLWTVSITSKRSVDVYYLWHAWCVCACLLMLEIYTFLANTLHKPYSLKNNTQSTYVSQPTRDFQLSCHHESWDVEHVDHE